MARFSKQEAEYDIKKIELEAKLSHPFALKMAKLICFSALSIIVLLGIFFGEKSLLTFIFIVVIGIIFSIIAFKTTYNACL